MVVAAQPLGQESPWDRKPRLKSSLPRRQSIIFASGGPSVEPGDPRSVASLLAALEAISRSHPDRVLRLRGQVPVDAASGDGSVGREPFELLVFRGFSSSVTHATAFDPDRPALPEGTVIETAELLAGPLDPLQERRLAAPQPVVAFLNPASW